MLTREEVIEMLKEVYNNDISDFNIDKLSIDELKDLVIEGCKPKSRIPVYDYSKIQIPEDTEFTETHKGPTPSGGAYSTAYFYDGRARLIARIHKKVEKNYRTRCYTE